MIKAQADAEDDENTKDLRARIKTMYPSIFIEVKKYIHSDLFNLHLNLSLNLSLNLNLNLLFLSPSL